MSDSRKKKRAAQQEETGKASKTDIAIAKYLREKCPKKQTLLMNQKVYYFIGSKAVDTLMDSKWAKGTKKEPIIFPNRNACVEYLNRLRDMELFARAEKITVKKVEGKKDKKKDKDDDKGDDSSKEKGGKKKGKNEKTSTKKKEKSSTEEKVGDTADNEKSLRKRKGAKEEKPESDGDPESPKSDAKDTEKKKKKIRLELHHHQAFFDSSDAYVWVYEPTSIKNILLGTGIVLGAIGVCLFPLWPPIVRQGVYYLSLVAIGLIGLLIAVSLFRYVVFGVVWCATMGKLHFWYLPNLTEDCGFFESFVPLYACSRRDEKDDKKKDKKSKKRKDGKESGKDEDTDEEKQGKESEGDKESSGRDKEEAESELDKEQVEGKGLADENDTEENGSYEVVSH